MNDIINGNASTLDEHLLQGFDIEEGIKIGKYTTLSPLDLPLIANFMQIVNEIKKIEEYICENFEEWVLDDPVEEEYIDDYHEIFGTSEEEISVFEEKFGISLPEYVKEFYRYKNVSKAPLLMLFSTNVKYFSSL